MLFHVRWRPMRAFKQGTHVIRRWLLQVPFTPWPPALVPSISDNDLPEVAASPLRPRPPHSRHFYSMAFVPVTPSPPPEVSSSLEFYTTPLSRISFAYFIHGWTPQSLLWNSLLYSPLMVSVPQYCVLGSNFFLLLKSLLLHSLFLHFCSDNTK